MLDDEGLSLPSRAGGLGLASLAGGGEASGSFWRALGRRLGFCRGRRHDVNANQVFAWRKLYRDGLLGAAELVPVGSWRMARLRWRRLRRSARGRMTIELGCGARVVVDAGVDASALSRVLIALAAR